VISCSIEPSKPEASVLKLRLGGFHREIETRSVSEGHHQTSFFLSFSAISPNGATSKRPSSDDAENLSADQAAATRVQLGFLICYDGTLAKPRPGRT